MFRYAKFKNIVSDGEQAENLDYIDKNQISGWSAEAVSFCKQLGIMTGDDTNSFNPKNSATRAETAAITQRFSEKLNNNGFSRRTAQCKTRKKTQTTVKS